MYTNPCFWAMILLPIAWGAWRQYLSHLDYKSMLSGAPAELEGLYDDEKQRKALAFGRDRYRFGTVASWFHYALPLPLLAFGVYGWLAGLAEVLPGKYQMLVQAVIVFAALHLFNTLLRIPFDYCSRFVLLERHGFNRSTKKLFWLDILKSLPFGLLDAIGEPLGGAVLFMFLGKWFWPALWLGVFLIGKIMGPIHQRWIQPLFNKYTPLPEGELKARAKALAEECEVRFKNIYVMDSSKRSSMANAYFTGWGRWRRCVLFDVLLKDFTDDEVLAILAHEIGHYRQKGLRALYAVSMEALSILGYFMLSLMVTSDAIAQALGGTAASFCLGFIALNRLWRPLTAWLSPIWVSIGRRMEYDADAESVRRGFGPAQITALKKLYKNNLGNLNHHPLWVKWTDPHPTLLQRIQFMEKMEKE